MLQAGTGANLRTMDIRGGVYAEGTIILGYAPGGGGRKPIQANQDWKVIADPLGSEYYLIVPQSELSKFCVGIGNNVASGASAVDDATDIGVPLTLQIQQSINNHYQLWQFVPLAGSNGKEVFIQNPQTGYVIAEVFQGPWWDPISGAALLIAYPRDIRNEWTQLWTAVDQSNQVEALPAVTMAQSGTLKGNSQYVFLAPSQSDHLTGITVTLDIIADLVATAFSLQINCNTPYLGPADAEDYDRDAQWMQFMLFMSNNQLTLANQIYHRSGPNLASEFPSKTETSPVLLQLENSTIKAGTKIILNLCMDQEDFVIGHTGLAIDTYNSGANSGTPIGSPVYWPAIGRDSWHTNVDGGKVHEKAMAPVGAFQVVFVGNPGVNPNTTFTSGVGTITITASPGIVAGNSVPNPFGIGTGENSNMPYGLVPSGNQRLIAQPFGIASTP
jgi:hypothetical protein